MHRTPPRSWSITSLMLPMALTAVCGHGCADEVPIDPCPDGEGTLPFHSVDWRALYYDGHPPRVYRIDTDGRFAASSVTDPVNGTVIDSCSKALAACGSERVGIDEVNTALSHPDVRGALRRSPITYGQPYLEPYEIIEINIDGHNIRIHRHCIPRTSFCANDVPSGVVALYNLLTTLADENTCLADHACTRTAYLGCEHGSTDRFYFDTARQECVTSADYCEGSAHTFESAEECTEICTAQAPVVPVETPETACEVGDDDPTSGALPMITDAGPAPCSRLRRLRDESGVEIIHSTTVPTRYLRITDDSAYWNEGGVMVRGDKHSTARWKYEPTSWSPFAVSDCRLYFSSVSASGVSSMTTGGGQAAPIESTKLLGHVIATDERALYAIQHPGSDGGNLHRIARGGGTAIVLVNETSAVDGFVHDGTLFWLGAHLLAVSVDGTELPRMIVENASNGLPPINGTRLKHDGTHIYFSQQRTSEAAAADGAIRRIAFSGGAPETIASGIGSHHGPIIAGSFVYWLEQPDVSSTPSASLLKRVAADGTSGIEILLSDLPFASELNADATHLYWLTTCDTEPAPNNPSPSSTSDHVVRWPLP